MRDEPLHEIDERIMEVSRRIDFYSFLTPLNQTEEKEKFFRAFREQQHYDPVFRYRRSDLREEKKLLGEMRGLLDREDDMQSIFLKKIDFMERQIGLLTCGDNEFTDISGQLYGMPDAGDMDLAGNILSKSRESRYVFPEETVTPQEMASVLGRKLEEKGIDWAVVPSDRIVSKISVSGRDRTVYVNSGIGYTAEEVRRLEVHEIEVHVYRGANGDDQPFKIFREGLAGYDEAEEGLAVAAEDIAGCLEADTRQMKLYAGRYVSVGCSLKGSFHETFAELLEFFPEGLAYRLAERGKRGLRDTSV
ncbi:MAG: DUF1704 domain-containing protein, partial [Candidatus Omnitrophica bacterium]|nr:DUF1704 domain-containing protein [Candidatus Omnitrophota bacterium]